MQINLKENEYKIENGNLVIKLNSDIEKVLGITKINLKELIPGSEFIDSENTSYIVIEHYENDTTRVLRKELLNETMEFGQNNNWKESSIREYLNSEYLKSIEKIFGSENIIEHEVDLFSHDGLRDYGISLDKVSLLTYDLYRNKRSIIGKNKDSWWWLATPDSTPSGYCDSYVRCVYGSGDVRYFGYDWNRGVRPVLILKSNIFVSLSEK
jgi:hypothetical protein